MVLTILFFISGAGIALLIFTKVREQKTHRQPVLLRVISLGDERMKEISHRSAHLYADTKEDLKFFLEKQLPRETARLWAKTEAIAKEKWQIIIEDLREAKILRKTGNVTNLTEYFQSLSAEENKRESVGEEDSQNPENTLE